MHAVNRLIHQLGDRHVPRDADQLVCLVFRQALRCRQEVDHLLDGDRRSDLEILVGRHADEVGCRLGAWPYQLHVLAHGELHAPAKRRFDRSLIDFAVSLRGVSVADLEQCAAHENRNEERAAGDQLPVVQVAGVLSRRIAADRPRAQARARPPCCRRTVLSGTTMPGVKSAGIALRSSFRILAGSERWQFAGMKPAHPL